MDTSFKACEFYGRRNNKNLAWLLTLELKSFYALGVYLGRKAHRGSDPRGGNEGLEGPRAQGREGQGRSCGLRPWRILEDAKQPKLVF